MKISLLVLMCILTSSSAYSNICFNFKNFKTESYTFKDDILIRGFEGVEIAANLFHPTDLSKNYPAVIFVNSWSLEDHEYFRQAKILAEKGYIVLSYSTRGFGCSSGKIDVIGNSDVQDLSKVVDWLEQKTNVDINNVGIAGISYGGGMALMALAKESRIKTGVSMSGWSSLTSALYGERTPRKFWTSLLITLGFLTGEIDETIPKMFKNLVTQTNIDETLSWAEERSPINFIGEVNKRNAPVFISQNYGDNLFQPNPLIKYFNQLTTPKILDLNQGTHATAEASGMILKNNYTFNRMQMWFDLWLKGIKNKKLKLNQVNIQTDLEHKRESYSLDELQRIEDQQWHLHPSRFLDRSNIKKNKYVGHPVRDFIISRIDTYATTGIPLLSSIMDGNLKIPTYSYMPIVSNMHAFTFKTKRLKKVKHIRGVPKISLNIKSTNRKYQLIAYLYDVDSLGYAKLITHGAFSSITGHNRAQFELVATAYDVPRGHRLALIVDSRDSLYSAVETRSQVIELNYESTANTLNIPVK